MNTPTDRRIRDRLTPPDGSIFVLTDGRAAVLRAGRLVPIVQGGHPHGDMSTAPIALRRAS
jgi:hypothetical protein